MIYTFDENSRNMEHEIGNISIARIRQLNPNLKGINNDFIMDKSEHYIPEDMSPFFKYPLRLDGIIISIREKGSAKVNINLREYDIEKNDLILCAPGDILHSSLSPGIHLSQILMISSDFLKEMYINLNSFIPFFISLKESPRFHLTEEEVQELKAFYQLIEKTVSQSDNFKTEIVRRLMGAYLYKIGSILHQKKPESLSKPSKALKREDVLFNQFINLLTEHHRKERRVDFYAEQLFLSPKHFSTVVKKVSGKTAGEWIDEYVILEAKALLKYSAMSIQEVAYFMNFPNPSFFGKYFKHHTGLSPSEYKMQ